jgi:hypothetical protein
LELQQIKTLSSSDAFRQIGYTPLKMEASVDQGHGKHLAIQAEQQLSLDTNRKQEGFFMTETQDFGIHNQQNSPLGSALKNSSII